MVQTDTPTGFNINCRHKRAAHRHGTLMCYIKDRCRCADCRAAQARYDHVRRSDPFVVDARNLRQEARTMPGDPADPSVCTVCARPLLEHRIGECLPSGRRFR
jgi:hypothetical protein